MSDNKQVKIALFDFDGVLVDTEPIYDVFWNAAGVRYQTGIPDFADVIKGTVLSDILEKYFADRSPEEVEQLRNEALAYEQTMALPAMPGSLEFLRLLKANGVRMGLVTSSDLAKVERAIAQYQLEDMFETLVTSDRISRGKPDPMCYLLAASDFQALPSDCLVFEDSYNGINAGTLAGMRVIGLSTTNPAETLVDKVYRVIPDFRGITFEDYLEWSK
jgi:HAD superfamily hydrolase (TIGR01509 family)